MGKFRDLTGMKYERLTVVEMSGRQNGHVTWVCKCECGKQKVVRAVDLRNGNTTSCGCLQKERVTKSNKSRKKVVK